MCVCFLEARNSMVLGLARRGQTVQWLKIRKPLFPPEPTSSYEPLCHFLCCKHVPFPPPLQLCQLTIPVPHLAIYTGTSDPPSLSSTRLSSCHGPPLCSGHIPLPNSTGYSSSCSMPLNITSVKGENQDTNLSRSKPFLVTTEGAEISMDSDSGTCCLSQYPVSSETKLLPKSRMNLSLSKFLKRGCLNSPVFATLSPKCLVVTHGKVQPLDDLNQQLQQKSKKLPK